MAKPIDRLTADLVRTALQFHRLGLWREIAGDMSFLLRLPKDKQSMVVFVMGQQREHFGLTLYRGADAIHDARMPLVTNEPRVQIGNLRSTALLVTYARYEALPRDSQLFLDSAGFVGRLESTAPRFLSLPQRQNSALPTRAEMQVLFAAMSAMMAIRTSERLAIGNPLYDDTLPAYHVSADGTMIGRTVENLAPIESSFGRALLDLASIAERPMSERTWLLGFANLSTEPATSRRAPDRRLLVFDSATGQLILLGRSEDAQLLSLGRELREALSAPDDQGARTRPRAIIFHDWALGSRLLSPALREIGIATQHVDRSDDFDRHASALADKLQS